MSEFMGKNGFNWFVGVVEDRADPKKLGRLRVRCLGYHTEDLLKLPTADLPWSHVMNPITSATISGIGQSPLGAVEGTWVVGFFQDGADAQMPVIIGTLPGVPSELPTKITPEGPASQYWPGKGFQDYKNANYPKYKDESDVNRLAVGDEDLPHSSLTIRQADRTTNIGRADFDEVEPFLGNMGEAIKQTIPGDDGTAFSEPETPYDATYPYNHVYESEAGHIREIDDTPTKERIHERHSSGTGYEIHPDGTKVVRTKMDNYDLTYGQHYTHIRGSQSTTVNGGVRVFVNASGEYDYHYTIQVGKNANVNIQVDDGDVNVVTKKGDINLHSGRNLNLQAEQGLRIQAQTVDIDIANKWNETSGNKTENTGAHIMKSTTTDLDGATSVNITGARIDLN
jgi:hypothetical protein